MNYLFTLIALFAIVCVALTSVEKLCGVDQMAHNVRVIFADPNG